MRCRNEAQKTVRSRICKAIEQVPKDQARAPQQRVLVANEIGPDPSHDLLHVGVDRLVVEEIGRERRATIRDNRLFEWLAGSRALEIGPALDDRFALGGREHVVDLPNVRRNAQTTSAFLSKQLRKRRHHAWSFSVFHCCSAVNNSPVIVQLSNFSSLASEQPNTARSNNANCK